MEGELPHESYLLGHIYGLVSRGGAQAGETLRSARDGTDVGRFSSGLRA